MKDLKTEQTDLTAERERIQSILDLIERQIPTLEEAIQIDAKLAELNVEGSQAQETVREIS